MIKNDLPSTQRYGFPLDWSVPGDDVVPEEMSYICTIKVESSPDSMVQIDPPSDDHTSEILQAPHLISSATPPVWISQIVMPVSGAQAMKRPSGE